MLPLGCCVALGQDSNLSVPSFSSLDQHYAIEILLRHSCNFILWQPNFIQLTTKVKNPKEDNFIMFYITQYVQNSSILECIIRLKINSSHSFFLPNLKFSVCFTLNVDQWTQYLRQLHELSWYWPVQVQRTRKGSSLTQVSCLKTNKTSKHLPVPVCHQHPGNISCDYDQKTNVRQFIQKGVWSRLLFLKFSLSNPFHKNSPDRAYRVGYGGLGEGQGFL